MQTKKIIPHKVKSKANSAEKKVPVAPLKRRAVKKVAVKKTVSMVKVPPEFTMKQVKEIVALIKNAGTFTTFCYKTDEFEIELSVGATAAPIAHSHLATQAISSVPATIALEPASPTLVPTISSKERLITSPMIGTFYRRPSPNAPPFVEVGDLVAPSTDVCIVEVMKLLNTIPAECSGRVSRILVDDGANIEAGQPLMVVDIS